MILKTTVIREKRPGLSLGSASLKQKAGEFLNAEVGLIYGVLPEH